MPWIDNNRCDGCGICIEECPVGAIVMIDLKAEIDEEQCIRCGTCHDICPQDASRHDSERIPEEIEQNINWVKTLLRHYETEKDRKGFIERIKRYFKKEIMVNELTLAKIEELL